MGEQQHAARHHRPITFPVPAEPGADEHPMVAFTRDIGRRLGAIVCADPEYLTFQEFAYDVPAVRGWTRHQIGIVGRTVVVLGTPDPYVPRLTTYAVEVDGQPARYRFTYTRPLAALLAEAAGHLLTAPSVTA